MLTGRYFIDSDCDGHAFVVPVDHECEWDARLDLGEDDEDAWEAPEWAIPIGGSPRRLTFTDPVVS